MSGAAGHILHLHENRDLTFVELKEILRKISNGQLEEVIEKFDGFNIVLSWDENVNDLRVARNGSDIKQGGNDRDKFVSKFGLRGTIGKSFIQGFDIIRNALSSLSRQELKNAFKHNGSTFWYSAEIIHPHSPTTITYDYPSIVFHRQPIFLAKNGVINKFVGEPDGLNVLIDRVEMMNKSTTARGWHAFGPAVINIQDLGNGKLLQKSIKRIDDALAISGTPETGTIGQYIKDMARDRAIDLGIGSHAAACVARRIVNDPKAHNIVKLKKIDPRNKHIIEKLIAAAPDLLKEFIRPIELAIHELAVETLKGLKSVLINDQAAAKQRIVKKLDDAISVIQSLGHDMDLNILARHMEKLGAVDHVVPLEGIVFTFKGQTYKLTGNFQPCHQIISLAQRLMR